MFSYMSEIDDWSSDDSTSEDTISAGSSSSQAQPSKEESPLKERRLPRLIFGLEQGQHRVAPLKVFVKVRRPSDVHYLTTKKTLLEILHEIEKSVSSKENDVISKWFLDHKTADRQKLPLPSVSRITEELSEKNLSKRKLSFSIERETTAERRYAASPKSKKRKSEVASPSFDYSFRDILSSSERKKSATKSLLFPSNLPNFKKECSICMEALPGSSFPGSAFSDFCTHDQSAYNECIATSIETQISELSWDQIKCPECPVKLYYHTISKHCSTERFQIYDKKSVQSAYGAIPNFAMCLNTKCCSGQIHDRGDDELIMTCKECKFKMCFVHKLPWHEGKTCAEYDVEIGEKVRSQEVASKQEIAKIAKLCPNTKCGVPIEKNLGCDHMTCKKCKHEFCWLCLAPYKDIIRGDNTAHARTCKNHTANLPNTEPFTP